LEISLSKINGQPADAFLSKYTEVEVVFRQLIDKLVVIDNKGEVKSVTLENGSPTTESQVSWLPG